MSKKLVIMNPKSKFSEMVNQWTKTRRAFAIIPNEYHGYSVISARKVLEIANNFQINTTIVAIPRKKIITFRKEDTVRKIIQSMFENNTRKLVLEDTEFFINDRIIIQKLARDFNCLTNGEDFLNMNCSIFNLEQGKIVTNNLSINEACRIMQDMESPYLMVDGKVISPWDMVLILASENLS